MLSLSGEILIILFLKAKSKVEHIKTAAVIYLLLISYYIDEHKNISLNLFLQSKLLQKRGEKTLSTLQ